MKNERQNTHRLSLLVEGGGIEMLPCFVKSVIKKMSFLGGTGNYDYDHFRSLWLLTEWYSMLDDVCVLALLSLGGPN